MQAQKHKHTTQKLHENILEAHLGAITQHCPATAYKSSFAGGRCYKRKILHPHKSDFQTTALHRPLSPGFPASTGLARAKSRFPIYAVLRATRHSPLQCGGLPFGLSASFTNTTLKKRWLCFNTNFAIPESSLAQTDLLC